MGSQDGKGDCADYDFAKVGGLQDQIDKVRTLAMFPLLYPAVLESQGMQAMRGILLHGPPGTGKTLVAGALVGECSKLGHSVKFYHRQAADCFNKYFGESEVNLRNLFDEAQRNSPSIIFFDEIDAIASVRGDTNDSATRNSIVNTLLVLMDGLNSKSQVLVIGATNRVDILDAALRRAGRFDLELYFPLPNLRSRIEILEIHTSSWKKRPSRKALQELAAACSGYCGADLKSICSHAVLIAFYRETEGVPLTQQNHEFFSQFNLQVTDNDLWTAFNRNKPAGQRNQIFHSRPLPPNLTPLLSPDLEDCLLQIQKKFPSRYLYPNDPSVTKSRSFRCPRWLVRGAPGQGHHLHLAPAILNKFDHLPVVCFDDPTEPDCVLSAIQAARNSMPCILYLPQVTSWWGTLVDAVRQKVISSLDHIHANMSSFLFIIGTADVDPDELPDLERIFPRRDAYHMSKSTHQRLHAFFHHLLVQQNLQPPGENMKTTINYKDEVRHHCNRVTRRSLKRSHHHYHEFHGATPNKKRKTQVLRELVVNEEALNALVEEAVQKVEDVETAVRLYDNLEWVCFRYSSVWDRTSLVQELHEEITNFTENTEKNKNRKK